ncbi:MAG: helix-turn-helix transcriptional regulator [Prevotella sp.]|nr:helix-turn-helix transcriptional regulator [Prevotella sp.]
MGKNVSDVWLANQTGYSRQTVNNWINGRRDITVGRLHEVAGALEVRVRDLFDE